MRPGDIVRFAKWADIIDINDWSTTPKKNIGLLIEYNSLMKLATVLHKSEVLKIRAQLVEKAGKKDSTKNE